MRGASGRSIRDPLPGVERLLIDGTNLLYRMTRGAASGGTAGGAARLPAAALIGRLRAVIPPATRIELVLDGAPEHGLAGVRLANGLTVRHSGRYSADSLLDRLVADAIGSGGTPEAAARLADALLVVTDDRELGSRILRRGARVAGADWLIGRLEQTRLSAPSVGVRRPPATVAGSRPAPAQGTAPTGPDAPSDDEPDRPAWRPGRGATAKTGNPRRRARMRR
ncbi:MAG TPA: hypothetical protein VKR24_08475 [Candidatus Limnocylindrales bacterium]|nr:hypothetical protein [Candidatus Limnocylindrales bacterium]